MVRVERRTSGSLSDLAGAVGGEVTVAGLLSLTSDGKCASNVTCTAAATHRASGLLLWRSDAAEWYFVFTRVMDASHV